MSSEILRKYIDIINEQETLTEEILEEGMLQKLAGLALGAVLALGPKVAQADTVFSYLDPSTNKMQTALDMSKVPTNAKVVLAIDTDTNQVMTLKGGAKGQEIKPDPTTLKQAQLSRDNRSFSDQSSNTGNFDQNQQILYGDYKKGMSVDEVVKLSGGKEIDKASGWGVVEALINSGKIDPNSIKVESKGTPWGSGETFYQFKNNKLIGIHFAVNIRKSSLKDLSDGEGLMGFKMSQLGFIFKKAFDEVSSVAGSAEGDGELSSGGRIGAGIGLAKATADAASGRGIGIAIPLDKIGNDNVTINTSKGYVSMQMMRQQGMVDRFRPGVLVIGLQDKNVGSDSFNIRR